MVRSIHELGKGAGWEGVGDEREGEGKKEKELRVKLECLPSSQAQGTSAFHSLTSKLVSALFWK